MRGKMALKASRRDFQHPRLLYHRVVKVKIKSRWKIRRMSTEIGEDRRQLSRLAFSFLKMYVNIKIRKRGILLRVEKKKKERKKITIKKIFFFTFRLEFDKISRFFIRTLCSTYVVYSILVVVVYVNKCANDKMVEHVFALSGNY